MDVKVVYIVCVNHVWYHSLQIKGADCGGEALLDVVDVFEETMSRVVGWILKSSWIASIPQYNKYYIVVST